MWLACTNKSSFTFKLCKCITHYHEPWGLNNVITTWCFFPGNSHADQAVWLQPWQCHRELPVEVSSQKVSCNKTHFVEYMFIKPFSSSLWKLLMKSLNVSWILLQNPVFCCFCNAPCWIQNEAMMRIMSGCLLYCEDIFYIYIEILHELCFTFLLNSNEEFVSHHHIKGFSKKWKKKPFTIWQAANSSEMIV